MVEINFIDLVKNIYAKCKCRCYCLCAKIEEELVGLEEEEATGFLADLGVSESDLEQIIHKAFDKLGFTILFLEKKVRAWTIRKIQKLHKQLCYT